MALSSVANSAPQIVPIYAFLRASGAGKPRAPTALEQKIASLAKVFLSQPKAAGEADITSQDPFAFMMESTWSYPQV
jgi:hypothetical protein